MTYYKDLWIGDGDVNAALIARSIKAAGKRPQDYFGRDLLINSYHDGRLKSLRRAIHKNDEAIDDLLERSPVFASRDPVTDNLLINVRYVMLFHKHYLEFLKRLRAAYDYLEEDTDLIRRLWNCPPVGVQFAPVDFRDRYFLRPCKQTAICPYCMTRRAIKIQKQLEDHLASGPDKPRSIGMLSFRAGDEDLWNGTDADGKRLYGGDEPAPAIFKRIAARTIGEHVRLQPIVGGLLIWQPGPAKMYQPGLYGPPEYCCDYRLTLLAEYRDTEQALLDDPTAIIREAFAAKRDGLTMIGDYVARSFTSSSIRAMLLGGYDRDYTEPKWRDGAIGIPSLPLVNCTRELGGKREPDTTHFLSLLAAFKDCAPISPLYGWNPSWLALDGLNQRRKDDAAAKLDSQLDAARAVWDTLCQNLNHKPGRDAFKQALTKAGISLSGKAIRDLTATFKRDDPPTQPLAPMVVPQFNFQTEHQQNAIATTSCRTNG